MAKYLFILIFEIVSFVILFAPIIDANKGMIAQQKYV